MEKTSEVAVVVLDSAYNLNLWEFDELNPFEEQ